MASPISIQFIDQALSIHTPFPLSYSDPNQKWLIRTHLVAFLHDHPSFTPSFGTFFHDDGSSSNLLCAAGTLRPSSPAAAPVPLTIWLHENHPLMAPIVMLSAADSCSLRRDHPFVAQSGRAKCPYLDTWSHSRSSLSDLLRNLSRLFSRDHPFVAVPAAAASSTSSSDHTNYGSAMMSKREALDRLVGSIHYDLTAYGAEAEEEARELRRVRDEAAERGRGIARVVSVLEEERRRLKRAAERLAEQSDALLSFVRVNDKEMIEADIGGDRIDECFEVVGGGRERPAVAAKVLECLAAERGVEDVLYALDKAVEEGVVRIEVYIKHVRLLAREQFLHRALLVKLRGSAVLR